jgi:hypothetical protein
MSKKTWFPAYGDREGIGCAFPQSSALKIKKLHLQIQGSLI